VYLDLDVGSSATEETRSTFNIIIIACSEIIITLITGIIFLLLKISEVL
jgi:hypothetical protein